MATAIKYQYKPIDRYVYLNSNDPSLFEIEIEQLDLIKRTYRQYGLTEPDDFSDMEKVDGYGLAPEDQKFTIEKTPLGLIELEKSIRKELKPRNKTRDLSPVRREIKIIERFWDALEENPERYSDEIDWIRKMWYYRLIGKFLFINGKVTYIPGAYWKFLNYWTFPNNDTAKYRDRDRRWSIGLKYCEVCTTTFKDIDPDTGLPVKNAYGKYDMIDLGSRTLFGANYMKARRVGDTSRIEAWFEEFITRKISGKVGIQGMSDENATTVFQEHFVQPFIKQPIYWKPIWDAALGLAPKNGMLFDDLDNIDFGLHALIDFATSSDKAKFDGKYLDRFHGDEFGKMQRSDPNDVIGVVKFCLATGAGGKIHGLGAITTTVDEVTDLSAGNNYMRFCNRSHFECRDDNGQTETGFVNFFFSSIDGLDGYIGPDGESIIDDPTPEQARFIGKDHGARKFVENKINSLRRAKDWDALALFRRQHPIVFLDCFTPPPKNQVLRRDLIEAQLEFLRQNPHLQAVRGDFYWKGGLIDGEVGWIPNPESGRFYMSRKFLPNETNKKIFRDNTWCPMYPDRFLGSGDTFGQNKTLGRKSNGGLVIEWRRDLINDPSEKEMDLVESDRDIITYAFRPDTVEEYCEDVLMASVYCGAMQYPERNKTNIIDHFERRGYKGYLLFDHDRNTGKPKPNPGWWNKDEIVENAIRWLADDIVKNIKRCYHINLLTEYMEFGGRQYLTDFDLIASKLGILIGNRNPYYQMVKHSSNNIDTTGWIPWYAG